MPVEVYLQAKTPELTDQESGPSAVVGYILRGSMDELEVYEALLLSSPIIYQGLWRVRATVSPLGGPVWEGRAEYGVPQTPPDAVLGDPTDPSQPSPSSPGDNDLMGPEYSLTTAGGTDKLVLSYKTLGGGALAGRTAPETYSLIGLKDDGDVEGVEIVARKQEWTTTRYVKMTPKFRLILATLTGTINDSLWHGWQPGQVLFLGAEAQYRDAKKGWSCTFKFAVAKERAAGEKVADGLFLAQKKRGWDYLWCGYETIPNPSDSNKSIKRPWYYKLEEVYPETDFRLLGLGG